MATIPATFLDSLSNSRALTPADSFVVEMSPFFDPTDRKDWRMVKALLHNYFPAA
jgi:hypothetical protein